MANYISQINVNGTVYEILSKYDNPVRFMGIIPDANPWADDPHYDSSTAIVIKDTSTTTTTFVPEKGHMVISKHREYVCIGLEPKPGETEKKSKWALVGSVKQSFGTIHGVNTAAPGTGSVVTGISIDTSTAITSVSIKDTDKATAITALGATPAIYTVITGAPETSTFSLVTDVSQQVVSNYDSATMNAVTAVSMVSGNAVGNKGTVVTMVTGANTTHTPGTIATNVTQVAFDKKTGNVTTSVTLPTLGTTAKGVMTGLTTNMLSTDNYEFVTSVEYTDPSFATGKALTSNTTINKGDDSKITITPSTGVVIGTLTTKTINVSTGNVLTDVSQADSTPGSVISEVTLPTFSTTDSDLQKVVTEVTGGKLVTRVDSSNIFVTSVSLNTSSTPSSSLFSVDSAHVLILNSGVNIITDASLTIGKTSAITHVGITAPTIGTANVIKSYTWSSGSVTSGNAIVSVGSVTGVPTNITTSVSGSVVNSFSSVTINTAYKADDSVIDTLAVVTESGTDTLNYQEADFLTGISASGTVTTGGSNALVSAALVPSAVTDTLENVNVVTSWTAGDVSTGSVITSFTGGTITTHPGEVVVSMTDSTINTKTGLVVTGVTYTNPSLVVSSTGVITYLNGASLATVDVIKSLDNTKYAVTSVPRANKPVIASLNPTGGSFATSVSTSGSNFYNFISGIQGNVVTKVEYNAYTVVTAAEEPQE